jgi:hypothetical protein
MSGFTPVKPREKVKSDSASGNWNADGNVDSGGIAELRSRPPGGNPG